MIFVSKIKKMRKLVLICILLNLTFIYNQSPKLNESEDIKEIIECVNTTENYPYMIKIKILNVYERNDNSLIRIIGEFLITNPIEMKRCLPKKQLEIQNQNYIQRNVQKDFNQEQKFNDLISERYNWKEFLLCLNEKVEKSSKNEIYEYINELITQIQNEDYLTAIKNEFRLRRYGNPIIIECHKQLIEIINTSNNE